MQTTNLNWSNDYVGMAEDIRKMKRTLRSIQTHPSVFNFVEELNKFEEYCLDQKDDFHFTGDVFILEIPRPRVVRRIQEGLF